MFTKIKVVAIILLIICLVFSMLCVAQSETRPKVGIVLGGGAARGFGHIGIIQAFEEAGIPVDLIVGTSMGSIVGGLYAAGYSTENLVQIVMALDSIDLFKIQLPPKGGIVNADKFGVFLGELLDGKSFDELLLPFYAVVTELRTGHEYALNDGQVNMAIQASMSIPGLFNPVKIQGKHFVDGGMKNAVPANVARDHGADVIAAVDVKKALKEIDHGNILHNFQLAMWYMIEGYVDIHSAEADIIIVPDTKYDSYMEYDRAQYFIEKGYEAGLNAVEEIKAIILELDPDFVFEPYKMAGYPETEVALQLERATRVVHALPSGVQVLFEGDLGHGQLPKTGISYSVFGNNEISIYGYKDAFSDHIIPAIQFSFRSNPQSSVDYQCWGRYDFSGPIKWELGAGANTLFEVGPLQAGSSVALSEVRNTVDSSKILWKSSTELRWFPLEKALAAYELAQIDPYIAAGFEISGDFVDFEPASEFSLGLGSAVRLFGMLSLNVRLSARSNDLNDWKVYFTVGDNAFMR